jgi:hypothetical protein
MKKKFAIIAIAAFLTTASKAQEGNWAIDVTFVPSAIFDASSSTSKTFYIDGIKARYFKSQNVAYRIGVGMELSGSKEYDNASSDDYTKTSSSDISIAPGIEKHFGNEKVSVYLGGEIPIRFVSSRTEYSAGAGNTVTTSKYKSGSTGFGINAVIGVDFYLFKNFYIGAELTPGFSYVKNKDTKLNGNVTTKGGHESSFGLSSSSGVRIGFRF